MHKRGNHNKKFKCEECNDSFATSSSLTVHIKVKHEGKRFHCSYLECSLSFTSKANANRHLTMDHLLVGDSLKKYREKIMLQ